MKLKIFFFFVVVVVVDLIKFSSSVISVKVYAYDQYLQTSYRVLSRKNMKGIVVLYIRWPDKTEGHKVLRFVESVFFARSEPVHSCVDMVCVNLILNLYSGILWLARCQSYIITTLRTFDIVPLNICGKRLCPVKLMCVLTGRDLFNFRFTVLGPKFFISNIFRATARSTEDRPQWLR